MKGGLIRIEIVKMKKKRDVKECKVFGERNKMNINILMNIVMSVMVGAILIGIIVSILTDMGIKIKESNQITYDKCCNGSPCSDTYYDTETKTCKNVFDERNDYYPYSKFSLLYLIIAFGIALVLVVRYMCPVEPEQLLDSVQCHKEKHNEV